MVTKYKEGSAVKPRPTQTTAPMLTLAKRRVLDTSISRIRMGGQRLTTGVAASITDASIEYGMEVASTLNITLFDPERAHLRSGVFDVEAGYSAWLLRTDEPTKWDKFKLVSVSKTGDSLALIFEDEVVWRLRRMTGVKKANRNKMTRAEFAYSLVKELTSPPVGFYSPELQDKQAVAKSDNVDNLQNDTTKDVKDRENQPYGFKGVNIKVRGVVATAEQRANTARVLTVCVKRRVSKRLLYCAVMTINEESTAMNLSYGDKDSKGIFQQRPSQGYHDVTNIEAATTQWLERAIKALQLHPNWTEHRLCADIQRNYDWSATNVHSGLKSYGRWADEARATVLAFLGADAHGYRGDVDRLYKEKHATYEFTRGDPDNPEQVEDSWAALTRLAEEVNWRCFAYRNIVYFISDNELIAKRPKDVIDEDDPGVTDLSFNFDAGKPVQEVTVICAAERWSAEPGSVITLRKLGPNVNGPWLVSSFNRSLFDPMATVTLRRYSPKKLEPAPEISTTTRNIDTGAIVQTPGSKKGHSKPLEGDYSAPRGHGTALNAFGGAAVDLGCPAGTRVLAVVDGTVENVHCARGGQITANGYDTAYNPASNPNGIHVYLKGEGHYFFYTHLRRVIVKSGQKVVAGQVLGESGAANSVEHVHFEVQGGSPFDGWV